MTQPTIGFIGLGLMGAAMVGRLQDKNYALHVLGNRNRAGLDAAIARGAVEATGARAIAEAADVIMLCMGTSATVEARMTGDDGVIAGLGSGKTVIDFGTSLPESTRRLGDMVAATGAAMLDAPLSRTPEAAKDGNLIIMGAGDKAAFDHVEPVLQDLGEKVFHLGPLGTGHTVKLINNFFSMTAANALGEAFGVAERAGIGRQQLYDVISQGPLRSSMMEFIAAYALEGERNKLAFSIRNALKDVSYYGQMTEELGFDSIVSTGTRAALEGATKAGHGDRYVSQMVDYFAGD